MTDNYVTGASGFIGSRLMARLTGETVAIPHENIDDKLSEFRRFFFLSAYGNMSGQTDEILAINSNVFDLIRVVGKTYCKALLKVPAESFVYVSSSSVNLSVQTPYSRTKRAAEEILQATSLPVAIVRPFSVTGAHEQSAHLIPTIIRSCMEGTPMNLVPDATHDYVDVEDVATGLVRLADMKATGIFEFGSGISTTNLGVLEMVEAATGKKANVKIVPSMRDYDTDDWRCKNPAPEFVRTKTLADSIREMVEAYEPA